MTLQSIAPATRTVPLGSGTVEITGLSIRKLTQLVDRFPGLLALAAGKMDLADLAVSAPEGMLAIVALGIVAPAPPRWWELRKRSFADEAALLRAFDEASTAQQIGLVAQIFEITFEGESARPFLEAVLKMIRAPETNPSLSPSATSAPNMPASSNS